MFKLLIFDWDGTVIDSAARIIGSMQQAADELKFPDLTDDAVRDIIGLGLPEAIEVLIPGIDALGVEKMRERYSHYFLHANEIPTELFSGVEQSLQNLSREGYRLAVATGKSRRGLNRAFSDTGLGSLFELSRCADETTSKPDPHMLHEILAQSGVSPEQALMIGDTEFDLDMGCRAGVPVAAVSYGAHHIDRLQRYNPVVQMDKFNDLEHWLLAR